MALRIPQLKESLCGCSLRTGTKVIGWVSVSLGVVILLVIIFLASLDMKVLTDAIGKEIGSDEKAEKLLTEVGIIIFLLSIFLIVSIFFDVMLLIGVYNDRKGFIFAWIVFSLVGFIIDLLATIATFGDSVLGTFIDLLVSGLTVYLILVVYSHYNNLKERRSSITSPPAYEI